MDLQHSLHRQGRGAIDGGPGREAQVAHAVRGEERLRSRGSDGGVDGDGEGQRRVRRRGRWAAYESRRTVQRMRAARETPATGRANSNTRPHATWC